MNYPHGKFKFGQRVKKKRGASWQGTIVGNYTTDLTPIGYAVESEREKGAVQIYPEDALELATPLPKNECCLNCARLNPSITNFFCDDNSCPCHKKDPCECACEECFEGRHCGNTKCGLADSHTPQEKEEGWEQEFELEVRILIIAIKMKERAEARYYKDHGELGEGYLGSSVTITSLQDHQNNVNKDFERLKSFIRTQIKAAEERGYQRGQADMKAATLAALGNMAIEVVGNSAATADQAIHTVEALPLSDTMK